MPRDEKAHDHVDQRAKDFGGALKRIMSELRVFRWLVFWCLLCAAGGSIMSIVAPNQLSKITDLIAVGLVPGQSMDLSAIGQLALLLLFFYVSSAALSLAEGLIMSQISNRFAKTLRTQISEKINRLPLRYFDRHQTGDVLSRITNDVDTVTQSLDNSLSTAVSSSTLLIGTVVMMFWTNWLLAITAIIASLVGFALMVVILRKSQRYFVERQVALGKLNSHIEETYSGLNVVKAYNGKAQSDQKFDRLNKRVYRANQRSQFLSGLMHPIMAFVSNFGYVAVCIVGALMTSNGVISFGVIVAFIAYVRLFTSPLSDLAQIATSLQSAAAASERVFEFVDEAEMPSQQAITQRLDKNQVHGDISFQHVRFGYDDGEIIIKDFSADVKAGQKVAIVGPTGAGKTTMVNLLMKFYDINDGEIMIDGVSTKSLSRENVRDLFTMVLQDTWMFEGSVRENILYNRKDVSDEKIMQICETIGLAHYIRTLPDGLNTQLSEGDEVSAGQKQLLTIARGMIEDAPFLILDEATSNVDTRTEELVQAAMDKLMEGRTSFIIAHRLSTIKNADLILVMNDGNIVESGNHKNLMKQNGFYAELYNSQFAL
ncbi:ABC transporter ATP-binding protein [Candidatus Saccharibacteria bacterium]|nr:ABC transporter ATP-binding protein [Candidatus Saccharibacteria bacterium]